MNKGGRKDDPIELAKASVSVREAAEMYGLKIGRNKMANCPYNNDRSPSFYIQADHFYCFGCGEHGDVIELTAGIFGLSKIEAARKLLNDFGVDQCEIGEKTKAQRASTYEKVSEHAAEQRCVKALSEYRRLLGLWKIELAPKSPEDRVDDPFLADKLVEEKEGILLWMLEGLKRLISNQYHFTISQRA